VSYARFSPDCDVYVFMSVGDRHHPGGWLECCWCHLQPGEEIVSTRQFTTAGMAAHLDDHVAAGHQVPDDVIPRLWADDGENFPQEAQAKGEQR
jgi:hypothetical protein